MVKIKAEELIELFRDKKVQEAFLANLSGPMALVTEELVTGKMDSLQRTCADLMKENGVLRQRIIILETAQTEAAPKNASLAARLNEQEAYSRRENIIIRGLPEQSYAEAGTKSVENELMSDEVAPDVTSSSAVEHTVISFFRDKLDIVVQPGEIHAAHRLRKGDKDKTRPVIVRFANAKVRDRVMHAKKVLRESGSGIYLSEHLTSTASKLFFQARALVREKKIASTWSMNGRIYFKRTLSVDEKPRPFTEAELQN